MVADRESVAVEAPDAPSPASASADASPGGPDSLDITLPPTPLRDLLAAEGAMIFLLSTDPALARAVEQAAGAQFPTLLVTSWTELVDAAAARRTSIVLLDVDALPVALDDAVAELHEVAPLLVVLVAARRDAAQALMSLLSEHKIHRLLIKPAAEGMTRLLLESAVGRYLQLREQEQRAMLVDDVPAPPRRRHRNARRSARRSRSPWLLAGGLAFAAVAAIVVAELYGTRWRGAAESMTEAGSAAAAGLEGGASRQRDIAAVVQPAAGAPARDELPIDGGNPPPDSVADSSAAQPLGSVSDASAERPLGSVDDASAEPPRASVADASAAQPRGSDDDASGGPLVVDADPTRPLLDDAAPADEVGLAVARAAPSSTAGADRPRDAEPASIALPRPVPETADPRSATGTADREATTSEAFDEPRADAGLQELFDLIDARIAEGRLLGPQPDSAITYLERVIELDPYDPRIVSRRSAIAEGLIEAARDALERGELDGAQRLAEEAFRLGAERESLARLDDELVAARRVRAIERQSNVLATATSLLRQGRLLSEDGQGALEVLAGLRSEGASLPGVDAAWQELTAAVRATVLSSIEAGDFETARRWAAALAIDGGDPELASALEFEARQAEFLATPAPAGTLVLVESPQLVYPVDAERNGIEGWVDLEYTVDATGRTRDIVVIDSRGRRFVDAALDVIAGQRYEPFVLDGRTYERRLEVRIRFELQ